MNSETKKQKPSFSVIIPTLNEENTLSKCISAIRSSGPDVEIIVVDGGSMDNTREVGERLGVKVLLTSPGRGKQCNSGAASASGDILIFLHADTVLPQGAFNKLADIFNKNSNLLIGTFGIKFDTEHWLLRLLSFLSRFDRGFLTFGDRGIVIRKTLFQELGGFPEWGLFEDLAFIRKARKRAQIHQFSLSVTTSARRFIQRGVIRQHLVNVYYTVLYLLGVSPEKLARKYYRSNLEPLGNNLVIFLRFPRLGKVKTRLAETLGARVATGFYRLCASYLMKETEKLPANITSHIYYAESEDEQDVRRWAGPRFRFSPQQGDDLGTRLEKAFDDLFQHGAQRVIIAATDVPDISAVDIEQAFSSLDKADMVIGPCTDGGYYLIGLKGLYPELFTGIDWSTDAVYRQTLTAVNKLGLRIHSLRRLDDIDTEDDLRRWLARSGLPGNTTVLNLQREEA